MIFLSLKVIIFTICWAVWHCNWSSIYFWSQRLWRRHKVLPVGSVVSRNTPRPARVWRGYCGTEMISFSFSSFSWHQMAPLFEPRKVSLFAHNSPWGGFWEGGNISKAVFSYSPALSSNHIDHTGTWTCRGPDLWARHGTISKKVLCLKKRPQ